MRVAGFQIRRDKEVTHQISVFTLVDTEFIDQHTNKSLSVLMGSFAVGSVRAAECSLGRERDKQAVVVKETHSRCALTASTSKIHI